MGELGSGGADFFIGVPDFFSLGPQTLRMGTIFCEKSVFLNGFSFSTRYPYLGMLGGDGGSEWGGWGSVGSGGADFFILAPQIHHLKRIASTIRCFWKVFLPQPSTPTLGCVLRLEKFELLLFLITGI